MSGLDARLKLTRDGFELDLPLAVASKSTVALLGPNGAGKSSVVSALAGLLPLEAGWIRLGDLTLDEPGRGIFLAPERRRTGVVFQDYLLFPHMSVAENVAFGLRSRRRPRSEVDVRVRAALQQLDLAELGSRRPGQLSGGQAQRVALARALVTDPALLLLDEPLAALDVGSRSRLRHQLADLLTPLDVPRLLITHDPTEAFLLADEICVIEDGRLSQVGSAEEIRLRPRTRYVAELAGANLLAGEAAAGRIQVGAHQLHVADQKVQGRVLATVHPRAVALHRERPVGSPRNAWRARVERAESHADRVRLQLGAPLPLVAEVTPDAVRELELRPGVTVWVSIKATEIGVEAD